MAKITVQSPDSIIFELTMSMTLAQWRKLLDQLQASDNKSWQFPAGDLVKDIHTMVRQAESEFYSEED